MEEEKGLIDADIVRLRQMYLEEKVNLNDNYVFLENRINRLAMRSFLNERFSIACPEHFEDITSIALKNRNPENGSEPFSILRMPHKSMVLALYETEAPSDSSESICDSFTRLFPSVQIDEKESLRAGENLIAWFSFRQSMEGRPFHHQVFSAIKSKEMIIGHIHTRMADSERCSNLLKRMLSTIQLYDREEYKDA